MKLIHTSDLHLGADLHEMLGERKGDIRRGELEETFDRMVDYARQNGVRGILIAGDLFDGRDVDKDLLKRILTKIGDIPEVVFFYVHGIHDDLANNLEEQKIKAPENLYLFGNEWESVELSSLDGEQIVIVTGANITMENRQKLYDSLSLYPVYTNIVLMNGQLERFAEDGKRKLIDIASLRYKTINYLALGYEHEYGHGPTDMVPCRMWGNFVTADAWKARIFPSAVRRALCCWRRTEPRR